MRKPLRWSLALIATIVILPLILAAYARHRAGLALERHEREVGEQIARLRARQGDGAGWELRRDALSAMHSLPEDRKEHLVAITEGDPELWRWIDVHLHHETYDALIDRLSKALPVSPSLPPFRYEDGVALDTGLTAGTVFGARLLAAVARWRHHVGRDREVPDLALLSFRLGESEARGGPVVNQLIAYVCVVTGCETFRDLLRSHALQSTDLERVARSLDELESAVFRFQEALAVDGLLVRRSIVTRNLSDALLAPSWQTLYSERLFLARTLNEVARAYRAMEEAAAQAPHEALNRDFLAGQTTRTAAARTLVQPVAGAFKSHAQVRTWWTLMRVAIALAWYEAEHGKWPPTLRDLVPRFLSDVPLCPLTGTPLGHRDGSVWSPGGDGDNDGGRPTRDDDLSEADGDFVWIVRRR